QLEYDDEVAFHARQALHNYAREDREQPFCLTVSFTHPHDPFVARQQFWDHYPEETLPSPATSAIAYEDHDPHTKRLFDMSNWREFEVTDQDVINSRRAYFANISYIDSLMAGILETLDACDFVEETIILFVSDHGEMLGEKGLWFKMSFLEGSARVPLMIHAPRRFDPTNVIAPASTLDVFPTLLDLAGLPVPDNLDGESLLPALIGRTYERSVISEYAAEGSIAPMVMVRDATHKLIVCPADPDLLFDLEADPQENSSLTSMIDHGAKHAELRAAIDDAYDFEAFNAAVLTSQTQRLLIYDALRNGQYFPWDYQPLQLASERYMRNHKDLNVLEGNARYPRFKPNQT
ncbi:MAG: choline-sulfatase, partial [Pseudomonadota bacterium]